MATMPSDMEYMALLNDYVGELRSAREDAVRRYEGRLRTWTQRLGSEARAHEKLASGPPLCCAGRVIAVVRKYWLACDALNRQHPAERIDPREFIVEHLASRSPDLARFLRPMPYFPLGKTKSGDWV